MGSGVIISETQPEMTNRYTWIKPLADGGKEYYEAVGDGWQLTRTEAAPAAATHTHTELGNLNLSGTLSVGGSLGLTGTRTVGGFNLTFKDGILTGFQQV